MSDVDKLPRSEVYDPTARMSKALRLGVLESTREWLRTALAENPEATAADLLDRASDEAVEAEAELNLYDHLNPDAGLLPSRNLR